MEKLVSATRVLEMENQKLKLELEVSQTTQGELAKQNSVYQKTIKLLMSRVSQISMRLII